METLAMIRQAFGEENMSSTQEFEWHAWFKANFSQVKSMIIMFFNIMGTVHKEFVLAGKTVNSAYYYHVLRQLHENVQRLRPKLWRQKN
jgi:hypothetical protein